MNKASAVRRQLGRWQELLAIDRVSDGRQLLRETLAGPLRMAPVDRSFRFEGIAIGRVLAGRADVATNLVPVRGFEPRFDG